MIKCIKCNLEKQDQDFYPSDIARKYFICKKCAKEKRNEYNRKHKYNTHGFDELAKEQQIDPRKSKYGWLKTKKGTIFFSNPNYEHSHFEVDKIDFEKLLENIKPIEINKIQQTQELIGEFDRLVFTDVHVGMDVESGGYSLYNLKWNRDILFARLKIMVEKTIKNQKSRVLLIQDLGDFLDGYEKRTTRGGHTLSQNMSTQDQFDTGLQFKITLIESLLPYFDTIHFINICNDNHAGAFGYLVNSALKTYCDRAYQGQVSVINQRKFIDKYLYRDKYLFLLCHGKDEAEMKFAFKTKIDFAQINKITNYISAHNLMNRGYEIEFAKGDSHQCLFDDSSSDDFAYYNYPAFSPSSNWVQTNFKKGRSGFVHFNYNESEVSINKTFFDD